MQKLKARIGQHPWITLLLVLVLLAGGSSYALHQKLAEDLDLGKSAATQESQLIASLVTTELESGQYENIDRLFNQLGRANPNIIDIRLTASNGFSVASYRRPEFAEHIYESNAQISYSYSAKDRLLVRASLDSVFQNQDKLATQLRLVFAAFAGLLVFLLHLALLYQRASRKADRTKRLYRALSETNQAIVRMEHEDQLFPLVCRCVVDFGGMKIAWIGQLDKESGAIIPVASHGDGREYAYQIKVSTHAGRPDGQGPIGVAMRENRPVMVNDYSDNPLTLPWRETARKYGWKSSAAIPIPRGGKPYAVLAVYHCELDAFDQETTALLNEVSSDIAFALDNFDREQSRKKSEESLKLAASIYSAATEAMLIADARNRIIAVNPAFTKITGFAEQEVIGKSASDLGSSAQDAMFDTYIEEALREDGHWEGEFIYQRKIGERYPIWLSVNMIHDPDESLHRRVLLFMDITQKKESEKLIWTQANFDPLTGLPNRRMFYDRLDQGVKKTHRAGLPLALVFIDLDHFKEVNDTLGHGAGDMLLKEVARRLLGCVRETDSVARLGGDEFGIILSELESPSIHQRINQDILKSMVAPFALADEVVHISASIGITLYPDDATDIESLLKNADQAMYAAKQHGRNRYQYFTSSMQEDAQRRMRLISDLRVATGEKQFKLFYQPIVDLSNNTIHKAEALIRWQHPQRGLVSPVEFIPLAETTGLILDIGEWVFNEAARQAAVWRATYDPEFQVSINKSPAQFHREDSKHRPWHEQLKEMDMPGESIVVEITEGMLMDAREEVIKKLAAMREAGITISLDDFGTGYSSLSYLKKFQIDYVKIDRSFTHNITPTSDDMALCEAIIEMAHKLGIKVIAEGVETAEQRDLLLGAGCDYGQGYLWSQPIPPAEFEKFFRLQ
jgi:diguanylate cyclase (GGDEF)-like protein/PAS domain S-box-containing protein